MRIASMFQPFAAAVLLAAAASAAPRMEVGGADFGEIAPNAAAALEVEVRNAGDAVLNIAQVRACCGATASMSENTIPPGGIAALSIGLNPGMRPGGFRKTVTIISDDPARPVATLPVTGRVKEYGLVVGDGSAHIAVMDATPAPPPTPAAGDGAGGEPPAPEDGVTLDLALPAILLAGLVDGFNPCAFSLAVLLSSMLAAGWRGRRARIAVGLAFCASSFATYFLLGLGLLEGLRAAVGIAALRDAISLLLGISLVVLAVISFRDAARYARTGDPSSVALRLPQGAKTLVRSFAESRRFAAATALAGAACGFVATLADSLCTGQVYVPVLALLARSRPSSGALALLALYNLAFIAPLAAVFLFAAYGAGSRRLVEWSKRNVAPAKTSLGILFLVLALLLLRDLRIRVPKDLPAPAPVPSRTGQAHAPVTAAMETREGRRALVSGRAHVTGREFTPEELAALNAELDAMLREPDLDPALAPALLEAVADKGRDTDWRNYCVQAIPECWSRLPPDSPLRADLLSALRGALAERKTALPGTALLGLGRLADASPYFSDEFATAILAVASDAATLPENRTTALALAAGRGIEAAIVPARHWAKSGETPLLRKVASDTAGKLEALSR